MTHGAAHALRADNDEVVEDVEYLSLALASTHRFILCSFPFKLLMKQVLRVALLARAY